MKNDLGPARIAIIEMFIGGWRVLQWKFMRNDRGRICLAVMNQVTEPTIVRLDVTLARAHLLSFEPVFSEVEGNASFLRQLIVGAGIFGNKDSNYAYTTGGFYSVHKRVHN